MSDWMGLDGIGLDGLFYTAVTPRASLKSDANNVNKNVGEEKEHMVSIKCHLSLR